MAQINFTKYFVILADFTAIYYCDYNCKKTNVQRNG